MAMWGLDVQQVRQLSSQLNQKAEEIQSILSTLTTSLDGTQWQGPDATAFRNEWAGAHSSSLRQVVQALQDASHKAATNATQQENAAQS
ncbi:WXG100 family type VII secretion target [Arthrobacter sp. OV608]|uniref:WXG100 family type VII secretion target n=1 Tax=Arthrobacter sp. OV608 TaxID=1882768 RepID=UPI0008BE759E|nr:WXG100 family type VII secretion target [Arthrobacter sp. OV608]SEQ81576.1 WXG100 family type VII secretion target [Arthrobacter sp. OV608]